MSRDLSTLRRASRPAGRDGCTSRTTSSAFRRARCAVDGCAALRRTSSTWAAQSREGRSPRAPSPGAPGRRSVRRGHPAPAEVARHASGRGSRARHPFGVRHEAQRARQLAERAVGRIGDQHALLDPERRHLVRDQRETRDLDRHLLLHLFLHRARSPSGAAAACPRPPRTAATHRPSAPRARAAPSCRGSRDRCPRRPARPGRCPAGPGRRDGPRSRTGRPRASSGPGSRRPQPPGVRRARQHRTSRPSRPAVSGVASSSCRSLERCAGTPYPVRPVVCF